MKEQLPKLKNGTATFTKQDESQASYFGRRTAADGEILWHKSAKEINNLVRAVTEPYPGAFSYLGQRKLIVWRSRVLDTQHDKQPGTVLSTSPLVIACGEARWRSLPVRTTAACTCRAAAWRRRWASSPTCAWPPSRTP